MLILLSEKCKKDPFTVVKFDHYCPLSLMQALNGCVPSDQAFPTKKSSRFRLHGKVQIKCRILG